MSPTDVRNRMEKSQIFIFTSDWNEGWGAVLNEAMNSGCAVVVSHSIGAAPYLIRHGENGYLYSSGNIEELSSLVKSLISNPLKAEDMGTNAYKTITDTWNASVAVTRFYELCSSILSGNRGVAYSDGPLSIDRGKVKNSGKYQHKKH